MNQYPPVIYRVNDQDQICFVNEAYNEFAKVNQGKAFLSDLILSHPLWQFITDETTRILYQHVVLRVREGRPIQVSFRCDSADCRRLMVMDVVEGPEGTVEFRVYTLSTEERPHQALVDPETSRSRDDFLRMCSWCKKIEVQSDWLEVEEAVTRLQLFEQATLPFLTHGICQDCLDNVQATLDESDDFDVHT